jgi:hypothetical protein
MDIQNQGIPLKNFSSEKRSSIILFIEQYRKPNPMDKMENF